MKRRPTTELTPLHALADLFDSDDFPVAIPISDRWWRLLFNA